MVRKKRVVSTDESRRHTCLVCMKIIFKVWETAASLVGETVPDKAGKKVIVKCIRQ